jgi:hypothetical protein
MSGMSGVSEFARGRLIVALVITALCASPVMAFRSWAIAAPGPGSLASGLVPSAVYAEYDAHGFSVRVTAVNRTDSSSADTVQGARADVCLGASRTTYRAGLLVLESESGCGPIHEYSFDPTDWTASLNGRIVTTVSITLLHKNGQVVRSQQHTASALVAFRWSGIGQAVPRYTWAAGLGYLPSAEAHAWLSKRASAQGNVAFAGLHRSLVGSTGRAALDAGLRDTASNDY